MTASRLLTIVLGVAAAAAVIYALSLVPSSRKPDAPPPKVEAPPPPIAASAPPAPAPRAPIVVAPPPPRAPAPAAPDPAPAPPSAPVTLESLQITDAEKAEIKPIVRGARERSRQIELDFKAGRLSMSQLDEVRRKVEAEVVEQLGGVLGDERAKQFMRLSRGRLPEGYDQ
ncbi:MAG TPA: hypothetical protein VFF06_13235 [Polyangia bacterium]|nr:hypothetical protein [Polyangia bacterium]